MKRPAQPNEGEIPAGLSEVPGGGPQAFTDPETGERMIEVEEAPVEAPPAPKSSALRTRFRRG